MQVGIFFPSHFLMYSIWCLQGFFRYWTPYIKKMVAQLSQAESEKESRLKNILQSLIGRFCEHHTKWRQLVSTVAGTRFKICVLFPSVCYQMLVFDFSWYIFL